MSDWQPIETAPKDGTHFLGYSPTKDRLLIVYWHKPANPKYPGLWTGIGYNRDRLSHWMPLPEPPK